MGNQANLVSYSGQQRGSLTLPWPLFSPALLPHYTLDIWTLLNVALT